MWGERERKSKRKNSSEICRTNTTFDFGAAYVEERDKIRCVGKEYFSFLFFQRCNKKNSLLLVERADAVSLETPVSEKSRRDVVGERLLDLGPNAEPWANLICSHTLKFSNGCWYFQGICIFWGVSEKEQTYCLLQHKKATGDGGLMQVWGPHVSTFPGGKQERAWAALTPSTPGTASEPESPHIWLQLALVCFKFCTQTTTLAANSGMAQPSLCVARGGGESASSPGARVRPTAFSARLCFC